MRVQLWEAAGSTFLSNFLIQFSGDLALQHTRVLRRGQTGHLADYGGVCIAAAAQPDLPDLSRHRFQWQSAHCDRGWHCPNSLLRCAFLQA